MRIGLGKDSHRLIEGRPLLLGGVVIPSEKGEDGHSDGDVLIHAIADAILGALGMDDIGHLWPDTDPQLKGMDSAIIARKVGELASGRIENIDTVVTLERPKLGQYKGRIRKNLASLLSIGEESITIKAKTAEGLDAAGRGEAIEAEAIVLLR